MSAILVATQKSISSIYFTIINIGFSFNSQVFYIIDTLLDVSCKIQHIPKGDMKRYINVLRLYFEQFGGLIMMGGDMDASSKAIAGIHIADNEAYLLVIVRRYGNVHKRRLFFKRNDKNFRQSDFFYERSQMLSLGIFENRNFLLCLGSSFRRNGFKRRSNFGRIC